MDRLTYRSIVRTYADGVRGGQFDRDLTPRQARITAVILATASNDGAADQPYPLKPDVLEAVITRTWNRLWDGNADAFADAYGPAVAKDYSLAKDRANTILRGI